MLRYQLLCWWLIILTCSLVACQEGLKFSLTPQFEEYPCGKQRIDAVLSIQTPAEFSGPPISLTSVIDKSGSMGQDLMDLVIKTNQFLVDELATEFGTNHVGFVTYGTDVVVRRRLSPLATAGSGTRLIKKILGQIRSGGGTNLSGGLIRGLEQQQEAQAGRGRVKAVFLFTDGKPSEGITDTEELVNEVRRVLEVGDEPIAVYTFGFGDNLNLDLLVEIADAGNGVTYIVADESDIPVVFGDALAGILSTVALDIRLTLEGVEGAKIVNIQAGGRKQEAGEDGVVEVFMGDMFQEEQRDILVTLEIPNGCNDFDALAVGGSYVKPGGDGLFPVEVDLLNIKRNKGVDEGPREGDPEVETAKVRFTAGEAVSEAKEKTKSNMEKEAIVVIANATAIVEVSPVSESPVVQAILTDLTAIRELLEATNVPPIEKEATLQAVEDALQKQRTGGVSTASGQQLVTTKKEELSETATEEILKGTEFEKPSPPPVPPKLVPPIIECLFDPDNLEINDKKQNVSVFLNLLIEEQPEVPPPVALVFLIDLSDDIILERIPAIKSLAAGLMEILQDQPEPGRSAVGLVVSGKTVVTKVRLGDLDSDSANFVSSALDELEEEERGEDSFEVGMSAALDILESDTENRRKVVVSFLGGNILEDDQQKLLEGATKQVSEQEKPVGVFPVLLGFQGGNIGGLRDLATTSGSHVVFLDSEEDTSLALGEMRYELASTGAQRVKFIVKTGKDVNGLSLVGGSARAVKKGEYEVSALDLQYGDWRQLDFQMELSKGSGQDMLLSVESKYFDVANFVETKKQCSDLSALRSQDENIMERDRVRSDVNEKLGEAEGLVVEEKPKEATTVIAEAQAIVNVTLGDDPIIEMIGKELQTIRDLLADIIGAGATANATEVLSTINDLQEVTVPRAPVRGSGEGVDDDTSVVDDPPYEESLGIDKDADTPGKLLVDMTFSPENLELSSKKQNVTASLTFRVPSMAPDIVNGNVVVLLDVSGGMSNDFMEQARTMLVGLILELSKRQGRRSLEILLYGEEVSSAIRVENVDGENHDEIIEAVLEMQKGEGDSDVVNAIQEGLRAAGDLSNEISDRQERTQLLWMVGSEPSVGEVDPKAIFTALSDTLKSLETAVTIFPLVFGRKAATLLPLVDALVVETSGTQYFINSQNDGDIVVEEVATWFEVVAVQDLKLVVTPLSKTSISRVTGPFAFVEAADGRGVLLSSDLLFGKEDTVKFYLDLPRGFGEQRVLRVSGSYTSHSTVHQLGPIFLTASRTSERVLQERDRVRGKTNEKLDEAEDDLIQNQPDQAVRAIAIAEAIVNVSPIGEDPVVLGIQSELMQISSLLKSALEAVIVDNRALVDAQKMILGLKEETSVESQATSLDSSGEVDEVDEVETTEAETDEQSLLLEFAPEFSEYQVDQQTVAANLTLQATELRPSAQRVSLSLVIDTWSGVDEDLFVLVRKTAKALVEGFGELGQEVMIGLITTRNESLIALPVRGLGAEVSGDLMEVVDGVVQSDMADVVELVTTGLKQQAGIGGKWRRAVAFVSGRKPSSFWSNKNITEEINRFNGGPQNPIAILSYFADSSEEELPLMESIAETAGGEVYMLSDDDAIRIHVEDTKKVMTETLIQNLFLNFKSAASGEIIGIQGETGPIVDKKSLWTVRAPSLLSGEKLVLKVFLSVDEVSGLLDLVVVNGSYFDTSSFKHQAVSSILLTINKAERDVLEEREKVREDTIGALDKAGGLLAENKTEDAGSAIDDVRTTIKRLQYLDDPLISNTRKELRDISQLVREEETVEAQDRIALLSANLGGTTSAPVDTAGEETEGLPTNSRFVADRFSPSRPASSALYGSLPHMWSLGALVHAVLVVLWLC